jgi:hypothetical protein
VCFVHTVTKASSVVFVRRFNRVKIDILLYYDCLVLLKFYGSFVLTICLIQDVIEAHQFLSPYIYYLPLTKILN